MSLVTFPAKYFCTCYSAQTWGYQVINLPSVSWHSPKGLYQHHHFIERRKCQDIWMKRWLEYWIWKVLFVGPQEIIPSWLALEISSIKPSSDIPFTGPQYEPQKHPLQVTPILLCVKCILEISAVFLKLGEEVAELVGNFESHFLLRCNVVDNIKHGLTLLVQPKYFSLFSCLCEILDIEGFCLFVFSRQNNDASNWFWVSWNIRQHQLPCGEIILRKWENNWTPFFLLFLTSKITVSPQRA